MLHHARVAALLLALALPAVARAGGVNLTWAYCGELGYSNAIAACNSNTRSPLLLVGGFVSPTTFTDSLMAVEAIVDFNAWAGISVPAWWQYFNPGACRPNSLSLVAVAPPGAISDCFDTWGGPATGAITAYEVQNNRARLRLSCGVPREWAVSIEPDVEYWAFGLSIDFANTTGVGACAGCLQPACLQLTHLTLIPTPGHPSVEILNPARNSLVTFQGGAGAGSCYVPTQNRTWGTIKSMYR